MHLVFHNAILKMLCITRYLDFEMNLETIHPFTNYRDYHYNLSKASTDIR